ncbi:hypothetical protein, partial [Klebsiella pneumoniae]|uniref:hypothetical protein n=1 Tax=Klebsiella pneumoniae TaxID=573 RepID=UPI001C2BB1DC
PLTLSCTIVAYIIESLSDPISLVQAMIERIIIIINSNIGDNILEIDLILFMVSSIGTKTS